MFRGKQTSCNDTYLEAAFMMIMFIILLSKIFYDVTVLRERFSPILLVFQAIRNEQYFMVVQSKYYHFTVLSFFFFFL